MDAGCVSASNTTTCQDSTFLNGTYVCGLQSAPSGSTAVSTFLPPELQYGGGVLQGARWRGVVGRLIVQNLVQNVSFWCIAGNSNVDTSLCCPRKLYDDQMSHLVLTAELRAEPLFGWCRRC